MMIINALVMIVLGVYGYFNSEVKSGTAFIGPAIGVILLALVPGVKKDNSTVAHIAVVLTALAAVAFLITGFMRSNTLVLIMAVVSLVSLIVFIMDFIRRKKERQAGTVNG